MIELKFILKYIYCSVLYFTVCVRPLLKDLYRHFVPHYATKWKDIGTLLGLNSQVLMMIEADHPNNVKLSCREMLQRWLYMDRTATWEKLFTVIDLPAVSSGQDSSKGIKFVKL